MSQQKDSCVQAAKGPIYTAGEGLPQQGAEAKKEERQKMIARVGKVAPDFEASAYVEEAGFKNVKLSDYKGQWVVLCFYPGDFTFV